MYYVRNLSTDKLVYLSRFRRACNKHIKEHPLQRLMLEHESYARFYQV